MRTSSPTSPPTPPPSPLPAPTPSMHTSTPASVRTPDLIRQGNHAPRQPSLSVDDRPPRPQRGVHPRVTRASRDRTHSHPLFRYQPAWHAHLPNLPAIDTFALSPPRVFPPEPVLRGTVPSRTAASTAASRVLLESPFGDRPLLIVLWIGIARLVDLCRASTFLLEPGDIADPVFPCTESAQGLANRVGMRTLALHMRARRSARSSGCQRHRDRRGRGAGAVPRARAPRARRLSLEPRGRRARRAVGRTAVQTQGRCASLLPPPPPPVFFPLPPLRRSELWSHRQRRVTVFQHRPPSPARRRALAPRYPTRCGLTTFLLHLPVPHISPSATNFASGLAWKGENKLVTDKPTSMSSRSLTSP